MKTIEYSLPKRRQRVFACVKSFLRIFIRKVRIVNLGEKLQDKCVYLCNHANKIGPLIYEMFFPVYSVKWGAFQMLGKYYERRAYLREVLYIRKNGRSKAYAGFKSFYEAYFSKFFYKGLKVLPTFTDMRLAKTIKKSVGLLKENIALMIFPEDSDKGYFDEPTGFFSGFTLVLENYFKKNGADVPVRCVYYHKKKRLMAVSESYYYRDFVKLGFDRYAVAEFMKDKTNELYRRIESGEFDRKRQKRIKTRPRV